MLDNVLNKEIRSDAIAKNFLANVFSYMFGALLVSGLVAWIFGTDMDLLNMVHGTPLRWVVMFAPFAFIIAMNMGFHKFSSTTLLAMFLGFSVLMGMSLSYIFVAYTGASVFSVFFIAAALFGMMALVGYTTKTDLTGFGSILRMALFGLIIAMVVTWFTGYSETMHYVINGGGVLIFVGLIAYETQQLKRIGAGLELEGGTATANKLAIMGAMSLYLSFINLFIFLLRLFGDRE